MKKPAALLAACTATFVLLGGAIHAYDSDPGFGPNRPGAYGLERGYFNGNSWYGGWSGAAATTPLYYRPTQRYYGPGYTVNYRFVPVFRGETGYGSIGVNGASNFRSEAFRISPEDVARLGADSPKIIVRDPKSAVPRSAVTSIVRKKTTSRATTQSSAGTAPAITTDAPAPVTPASGDR